MNIIRTDKYDVAVLGGGTAGFAAAVAAVDTELLRNTLWADGVLDPDTLPFE